MKPMWLAPEKPTLQGVRLVVPDLDVAVMFAEQVLGLKRVAPNAMYAQDTACFRLGTCWLAFESSPVKLAPAVSLGNMATLHWRCSDLQRQRARLVQLGFDSQNDAEPDDAAHVHVIAAETGACALQWDVGPDERPPVRAPTSPSIIAMVLDARAPERVAAHWAQVFQVPVERHTAGIPQLTMDGISIQFVFAEEGAGGVRRMTVSLEDTSAVRERAAACGFGVHSDTLTLAGLTLHLASA